MKQETKPIGDFLVARGGPFYTLQRQLGLLHETALRAPSRAALLVGLAWGVPLLLAVAAGDAWGPIADNPYLLDLRAWARYFVAVGLFILMEPRLEQSLHKHLQHFVRAPLLAFGSFEAAANAVNRALRRRDYRFVEMLLLLVSLAISMTLYLRLLDAAHPYWGVQLSPQGNTLTASGWWLVIVSNPLFVFLLLRSLWRLAIWSMLLRELAGLELRLVATHPDGQGGLAFLGQYPNAYTLFVFAISCVLGATIAYELLDNSLSLTTYGYLMAAWLAVILLLFTLPLSAYHKLLTDLKERTLLLCSSQATRYQRAAERELLGENVIAGDDAEQLSAEQIPDSSKTLLSVRKLSTFLLNREGLLPVSAAALLPLVAAGATQLPFREIFDIMKKLILI